MPPHDHSRNLYCRPGEGPGEKGTLEGEGLPAGTYSRGHRKDEKRQRRGSINNVAHKEGEHVEESTTNERVRPASLYGWRPKGDEGANMAPLQRG